MGHWLQSNFVLSHRKSIRSRICWLHWFLCVAQRSQFWAARLVNMISSGRVIHRTFGVSTYDACADRCITIQCRPTHVGHQPICNKSHFTVWLEVSLLDVYSIGWFPAMLSSIQDLTNGLSETYNKMFSHGYSAFKSLACILLHHWTGSSVIYSVCLHMCRKGTHLRKISACFLDFTVKSVR